MLLPSVIFEEFGLKYYGPIDGHDIPTLIHTLESLKRQKRRACSMCSHEGKGL